MTEKAKNNIKVAIQFFEDVEFYINSAKSQETSEEVKQSILKIENKIKCIKNDLKKLCYGGKN